MKRLMSILLIATFGPVDSARAGEQDPFDRVRQLESQVEQLQQTVKGFEEQVGQLQARLGETWMNERRAEQVKALVRQVLADAETRASLLDNQLTAGHDGHFFLASADGRFRLEFAGHLQVRYTFNARDDAGSGADDNLGGFNLRRAKFKPSGHVTLGGRRIAFAASLAGDQDRGDPPIFEDYYLQTEIADGLSVRAGRWKQPFAIQNLTSSARQLAVERSAVHELFRVDRSEGVMVGYQREAIRLFAAINDGMQAEKTDFNQDDADFAVTGRAEWRLAGDWKQFGDPAVAWSGEPTGLLIGAAAHYQAAETGHRNLPGADGVLGTGDDVVFANDEMLNWTADLTFEQDGFGVLLAGYGHHAFNEMMPDFNDYGLLVEAGYFVVPDVLQPFVRYELILADDARGPVVDGSMSEQTDILTAGLNWYQARHNAKFTIDVVYAFDPLFASDAGPGSSPDSIAGNSLGLQPDAAGQNGQFAIRTQYQLIW